MSKGALDLPAFAITAQGTAILRGEAPRDSYTYYARYLLSHARVDEARAFLQSALELSPADLTARGLLAQANDEEVNQPAPQTPEFYLDLSLQFYGEERYVESIVASRRALDLDPATPNHGTTSAQPTTTRSVR